MTGSGFVSKLSVASLGLMLFCGPALGFDPTRPLTDYFPAPLATTPDDETKESLPEADQPSTQDRLIELVNQERWNNGQLAPLKRVDLLDNSSQTHSVNMANRDFFMHCDPDTYTWPWDRMVAAGYIWSGAAENIAAGYSSPEAAIAGWMGSSGHRANILSTSHREMGNGYHYQAGDQSNVRYSSTGSCTPNTTNGPWAHYWTQNFGYRSSVYPVIVNREAYLTESRDVNLYFYSGGAEMRLRNEDGVWTAWQPFSANAAWQLSFGNGTKTVNVEMRSGSTVRSSSDTIILENTSDLLFADDFETGTTSAWSDVNP